VSSKFYLSDSGKKITLTDEMIALRDNLAVGLGYVKRNPCSLRGPKDVGTDRGLFDCWERVALDWDFNGHKASGHHCVADDEKHGLGMHWPEDVMKAAKAIDKGKPPKKTKEKSQRERVDELLRARKPVTP
jgi:hypothetical protein